MPPLEDIRTDCNKTRVMLVDDHAVLRAGMAMLINSQDDLEVVADAGNAESAISQLSASRPDVIILDLTLPGGPSLPKIGTLMACASKPRVMLLTMHDDPAYVRAALSMGATGYVVKTVGEQQLLQAVRAVARGRIVIDLDNEELTANVFQSLVRPAASTTTPQPPKLSERETEILKLLGQGHANIQIAEMLDISPKTVATYRARIHEKLGLKSTADFVKFVNETGTGSD